MAQERNNPGERGKERRVQPPHSSDAALTGSDEKAGSDERRRDEGHPERVEIGEPVPERDRTLTAGSGETGEDEELSGGAQRGETGEDEDLPDDDGRVQRGGPH